MTYSRLQNYIRSLALGAGVVSISVVAAGCALDDSPELGTQDQAATFDWGASCDGGNGEFAAYIPLSDTVVIGQIPPSKKDVVITLEAPADVDVQLIDEATGYQIIAWPSGALNGPDKECTTYNSVEYCYSGYNGYDSDNDGVREQGSEKIEIFGVTNRTLIMKAFGYQSGNAVVEYAFGATNTCNEQGSGEFSQAIPYRSTVVVGDIPVNKVNVFIELEAAGNRDVDVQLIDAVDGTEIVSWPSGLLNGASEDSVFYQGMNITYSGYNGRNGNWGHEDIRIDGRVTRALTMRAYGYQSGTASVSYEWGLGAGATCGSRGLPPCGPGLMCKDGDHGNISVDVPGECHTEFWCESQASAASDCANVIHIAVPGQWACVDFSCQWQPTIPGGDETCEIMSVDSDCAGVLHPAIPGSWGCNEGLCNWVANADVDLVAFEELKASPVAYADGRIIQVTWSVEAMSLCHPCDPVLDDPDSCANPCESVDVVLGDEAPEMMPPLGNGGDFVVLAGVRCQGAECDYDRGSWVTAVGRLGLLQGGHLRMQVLRTAAGDTCSLADQSCADEMHCQIGIGCPTSGNCGINPPGMCLED